MNIAPAACFLDSARVVALRGPARALDPVRVRELLEKARRLQGLDAAEMAVLMDVESPELLEELFAAARHVKETIYGGRIVMFAPLYLSSHCDNECVYCAFRSRNTALARRALSQEEVAAETRALVEQGHKRVLLVSGETRPDESLDYILQSIATLYKTRSGRGEIRRVNVNLAPMTVPQFQQLKGAGIGTYQLFQETYHRPTYAKVHLRGPKSDFDWRLNAPDRAMQAGLDDLGLGVLFGLYDWKYELLALRLHIAHLESTRGVGPHTLSVPRLEPADGSTLASQPPHAVSDADFRKIIAILRLTVPYTGIILSTRETAATRREGLALGVSQISAGSRTDPGGYASGAAGPAGQFQLGDHRPLDEVVRDLAELGYLPSFCTACYRLGRTGRDFMDLAKVGLIKRHCAPNALSSFEEYLRDYASPETRTVGRRLLTRVLDGLEAGPRRAACTLLEQVAADKRDVFV